MDAGRKKQLQEEYRNRRPEMGVLSFKCVATGEAFLGASKDIRADINSNRVKLESNWHPNRRLLELWNRYGESGFEIAVIKKLDYEDPAADHTGELEKLRDVCLGEDPAAKKIWR